MKITLIMEDDEADEFGDNSVHFVEDVRDIDEFLEVIQEFADCCGIDLPEGFVIGLEEVGGSKETDD